MSPTPWGRYMTLVVRILLVSFSEAPFAYLYCIGSVMHHIPTLHLPLVCFSLKLIVSEVRRYDYYHESRSSLIQ